MKELDWQIDVPLLTNRFIVYDLFKLVGITGVLFFMLLAVTSIAVDGKTALRSLSGLAQIDGFAMLALLVLLVLVILLFFFNHFPMGFHLSAREARVESLSRRGKWGNRLALVLGVLSGKPGVAGAGLLGMAQELVSVEWREVCRINVYPQVRVISLMNSWRVVFRLYCTPDNFNQVLEAVRGWAEAGRQARERAARHPAPRLWPRQAVLSLLIMAAGLFLAVLPLEVPAALKVALPLVSLATVWLFLGRFWGVIVLGLIAAVLISFLSQALETHQMFQEADFLAWARQHGQQLEKVPEWVLFKRRAYQRFHAGDWAAAGVGSLGLLFFGWLGLAASRGRLDISEPRAKGRSNSSSR
jgi:hypothetical protein